MRVLAVTGDAPLLVSLTSMMRGWEVQIVPDPHSAAEAAPGAAVVLVDSGTTERGLETAEEIWQLGVQLPCLVVGDIPSPEARARVLVRPFNLRDLISAIDDLAPKPLPATAEAEPVASEPGAIEPIEAETVPEEPRSSPEASQHAPASPPARARGLFRRKAARVASAPSDPIADQLRRALAGLQELDVLIEKLPPLSRPRSMAHAFLGEVVERFRPEIAAVYVLGNDGTYRAVASHGLSPVEAAMKVPSEQLLFMEVTTSLEAVLIAPIDLAQGLVSGIGGARTSSIMAAPVTVDGACHGVVVVGRKDFAEADLDALADLANEAGPGLAVAQTIDRFRSR